MNTNYIVTHPGLKIKKTKLNGKKIRKNVERERRITIQSKITEKKEKRKKKRTEKGNNRINKPDRSYEEEWEEIDCLGACRERVADLEEPVLAQHRLQLPPARAPHLPPSLSLSPLARVVRNGTRR